MSLHILCTLQVLYMFIQSWVDELVSTYLGSGETAPSTWLNATVAVSSLPPELQAGVGAMGVPGVEVGATVPTHVSPWQVVMRAIETLVNPEGRVGRTSWEFELSKVRCDTHTHTHTDTHTHTPAHSHIHSDTCPHTYEHVSWGRCVTHGTHTHTHTHGAAALAITRA